MFDIKLNILPVKLSFYVGLPSISIAIIFYYFQRSLNDSEGNIFKTNNLFKLLISYININLPMNYKLKQESLMNLIL